ncbi:hypothetical protein [Leifsonia poae]|uniref:hypothetical protein n=1 Tax=Leifsonia poae TaxID=110933 RepID=UPI003D66586D
METDKNQQQDPAAEDVERTPLDELGETDEDRLETIADRNESLEERLPDGDDLRARLASPEDPVG